MITILRLLLTVILLTLVWINAHWSVALTLSLIAINAELSGALLAIGILKNMSDIEKMEADEE